MSKVLAGIVALAIILFVAGSALFAYALYCAATHPTLTNVLFGFFGFIVGGVLIFLSLSIMSWLLG